MPAAAKPETISAVAVLLWSRAVMPRPAAKPRQRPRKAVPSTASSRGPSARSTALRTMWVPHRSSAA